MRGRWPTVTAVVERGDLTVRCRCARACRSSGARMATIVLASTMVPLTTISMASSTVHAYARRNAESPGRFPDGKPRSSPVARKAVYWVEIARRVDKTGELRKLGGVETGLFGQLAACYVRYGSFGRVVGVTGRNLQRPTMVGDAILLDQRNHAIIGDGQHSHSVAIVLLNRK